MTLLQMCDGKQFKRCGCLGMMIRSPLYFQPHQILALSHSCIACFLCVFDEVEKGVVLYYSYHSVFFVAMTFACSVFW